MWAEGRVKHSLKEWKYPWPHLQLCVCVCVGVSVPPHPAIHTSLPAIGRSGLTGRKIISCFHQRINRVWHYKCDSETQNVKWFSWMSIVSVNRPFGNICLYFAEVIMLTLALHAVIKHRILGHLFYSYVFFSSDIFSSVRSYSESFTQCLHCHEALLFSQGCSPVVSVGDYVGVCVVIGLQLSH